MKFLKHKRLMKLAARDPLIAAIIQQRIADLNWFFYHLPGGGHGLVITRRPR